MPNITIVNIDPANALYLKATDSNNSNAIVFSNTLGPRSSSAAFQVVADRNGMFAIVISGNVASDVTKAVGGGAAGHPGDQVEVSFGATIWVSRPRA